MASTELATVDTGSYIALNHDVDEVREIIASNLGGEKISPFDLPRVGIPAGGATRWEIPTLTGTESAETLDGVVIHHKFTRAYWPGEFQGSEPPQCSSPDGRVGYGDPGGDCETCPLAQYGSDTKGRGQACKLMEQWFVLREGSLLPLVVTLPPGSLKGAKQYRMGLASAMLTMGKVVTRLRLDVTKNADGIKYSFAVPELGGTLDPDAAARAKSYAELMRPILDAAPAVVTNQATDSSGMRAVEGDGADTEEA